MVRFVREVAVNAKTVTGYNVLISGHPFFLDVPDTPYFTVF